MPIPVDHLVVFRVRLSRRTAAGNELIAQAQAQANSTVNNRINNNKTLSILLA